MTCRLLDLTPPNPAPGAGDSYYQTCLVSLAGVDPREVILRAAVTLYDAGYGSKSQAALDARSEIGAALMVLNGAPLGFQGPINPEGQPFPDTPRGQAADLSGGDPGYRLITPHGVVTLTLETPDRIERKAAFATIADAEAYLNVSTTIDPIDLDAGHYGINAPHGLGHDDEARPLAQSLGFDVFASMGNYYWTKGAHGSDPRDWSHSYPNPDAAAFGALATVES